MAIPDLDIDEPLARRILARLHPPLEPTSIARLRNGGGSGAIFFVATTSGMSLVVKAYPPEPWWRMAKESYVAGLLAEVPEIPSPRFLAVDESRQLMAFRYAVMTRLVGEPLSACEERMNDGEIRAVWTEVGTRMRRIHEISMEAFGYIADGKLTNRSSRNRGYMDAAWRSRLARFRELADERALAGAMEAKWRARRELLEGCGAPKLCHYDIHPGNLLACQDASSWRFSGLFDFEDSIAADPLLDIAKCVHFARAGSGVRWRGLLAGYGRIDRPDWESTVDLYRLYQAVEYWVWIAQLRHPATELGSVLSGIRDILDVL
jgi:aminoglycoside phosphotransferase (APT) family kinase protein